MVTQIAVSAPRVAEFFAGAGLVRMALEQEGCRVVFANDISPIKRAIYAANFDAKDFRCCDIRDIDGEAVPPIDLATASFPCTNLSIAGNREGLDGEESSFFWEFVRVLRQMGDRRPKAVMLENVEGFATSNGGEDLAAAIAALNDLHYTCDLLVMDARWFVPQSRPRLFIIGSLARLANPCEWDECRLHPEWVKGFALRHPELSLQAANLPEPSTDGGALAHLVEQLSPLDGQWWDAKRLGNFLVSLSAINAERLEVLRSLKLTTWATCYRRTRDHKAVWEIRPDDISGCLRTTGGGSSRQALVEAGFGNVRVRWMTAREYARLQGAPDLRFGEATERQASFALGDAVCVPCVAWLARHYLIPMAAGLMTDRSSTYG